MAEAIDPGSELFGLTFRPRKFENICVLSVPEDFNPGDSKALSLLGRWGRVDVARRN